MCICSVAHGSLCRYLRPLQLADVLDDFRRFILGPQRVRFVGVPGGEQSGRRLVRPVGPPVTEPLKVEVDVRLLPLVHRTRFYHPSTFFLSTKLTDGFCAGKHSASLRR
jgi:hypothetical protein